MRRRRWPWIMATVLLVGFAVTVFTKGMGFSARAEPSAFEERAMLAARRWATPSAIRSRVNPTANTEEVVRSGRAHWADHCAVCHANDGSGDTDIGGSLYPRAPDMRGRRTQEMTDGELFYVIEHGIPFTGMPAWSTGTPEGEQESWALVRFIRHLPRLTDAELSEMEKLNPKSASQSEQERRIDDFLKGKSGK